MIRAGFYSLNPARKPKYFNWSGFYFFLRIPAIKPIPEKRRKRVDGTGTGAIVRLTPVIHPNVFASRSVKTNFTISPLLTTKVPGGSIRSGLDLEKESLYPTKELFKN